MHVISSTLSIGKIDKFYFGKPTCAIAYLNVWLSVPPRPKPEGKKRKIIKYNNKDA